MLSDRGATVVILTKYPPEQEIKKRDVHTYICDVSEWKAVSDIAAVVRKEASFCNSYDSAVESPGS